MKVVCHYVSKRKLPHLLSNCLGNLVANLVVNAEPRATILQVPDVQAGLGTVA